MHCPPDVHLDQGEVEGGREGGRPRVVGCRWDGSRVVGRDRKERRWKPQNCREDEEERPVTIGDSTRGRWLEGRQ